MIVLVRAPTERRHAVANFGDDVIAPHKRRLVVARLALGIERIGQLAAIRGEQEEFRLDPGFHAVAEFGRLGELVLEHDARRVRHLGTVHPAVAGEPADFRLPRQNHKAGGIGNNQHVGIGGCAIEPGGERGETGAVLLPAADRRGRHQLGAQDAEIIDKTDEKIFELPLLGDFRQISRHVVTLFR